MCKWIFHIIKVLALLALPAGAFGQINTNQVLRVGQNALYFEDYVLSIQYFNQVINAKPYLPQPYLMRAIAKLNLDDLDGAVADATHAIELNPFITDAWEVRGVARQNKGEARGAIADYDEALKLLPHNRQIMFNRAMALTETTDTAMAEEAFAEILRYFPAFGNAYLGRAKLLLAKADTVGASADIEKALSINPNSLNGYILRASIAMGGRRDYAGALADMDRAVRLEPQLAGLYINRAFLRYSLDDYFGAMADYDYALQLEPSNPMALFNRSLLEMEVGDNDKALRDLTKVLQLEPSDYRARYNRALVYSRKGEYDQAIDDVDMVIARFPDFAGAYSLRSEFWREKGELAKAQKDYDKAWALAKAAKNEEAAPDDTPNELTAEAAAERFNTLLTTENDTPIQEEYNNQAIRGRVQDRSVSAEIEPLMELSYYSSPNELKDNTYYVKEVDDLNTTRMLRFVVVVTPDPPALTDPSMIQRHFNSIEYYNSYMASHTPRAIDYLGRALDLVTVKNYDAAIADADRALELTPELAIAYMLRAQARYHSRPAEHEDASLPGIKAARLMQVLDDYNKAVELQPLNAVAWFDKGNLLFELGDYTSAIASYAKAIELNPQMGEAYYNRGYVMLKMGNHASGIADLSKAGELGVVSAYNLLKRLRVN